ncbi:NAD(P)/FAD-dependent oxidoreductase [Deinococcus altitudinis]|uniref:NAD(P)/FAD-dependent oxidoreductase n=1 Tax=Deinococcus altitudinis TaxID=468914 RepID=UPI00389129F2
MSTGEQDFLVVGAGLAGLALARELARAGKRVTVLDKARGVSGRSSTRRLAAEGTGSTVPEAKLDHGARFFTARNPLTKAFVQESLDGGWLAEWTRSIPKWENGRVVREEGGHPRYVPPAGMNMLGRELARGLTVQTEAQVGSLKRADGRWTAECQDGRTFAARTVLLNLPAPQIAPLLSETDIDVAPFQAVQIDPCWAVGAVLNSDIDGADWPALRVQGHGALDWIAREQTKRPAGHPPALMLHARADWTRVHLQDTKEEVQTALLDAAREVVGPLDIAQSFAHRWLYATPTARFPDAYGWLPEAGLGWCGDWCTPDASGPRVEAALLSGWELAAELNR